MCLIQVTQRETQPGRSAALLGLCDVGSLHSFVTRPLQLCFSLFQDYFGNSRCFSFHTHFRIFFYFCEKLLFNGNRIESIDELSGMDI